MQNTFQWRNESEMEQRSTVHFHQLLNKLLSRNVITWKIFCHSVSVLHDSQSNLSAVVQMEWLVSVWELPPKWHAMGTLHLYFTTGDTDNPCRHQRAFTEKQKSDKPIIVLTDLPHRYQSLQVLVGLVRVDVVQRAAVPGVSIRGCEVNGNLVERKRCAAWTIW